MSRSLRGAAAAGAVAGVLAIAARDQGAYWTAASAPLAMVLVLAAAAALAGGRRPSPPAAAAAALVLSLGALGVASTAWGGLPGPAWDSFSRSVAAAAAVLFGSLVGARLAGAPAVAVGVVAGAAVVAGEALVVVTLGTPPGEWFNGRVLDGPVGYHNAQGALFALAVPPAVAAAAAPRPVVRALSGATAALLVAGLLLTQSRGAVAALALALALQVALVRRSEVTLAALATAAAAAVLVVPLRAVDGALLTGSASDVAAELQRYGLWTLAAIVALAGALAGVPALGRTRRLAAGAAALVLVSLAIGAAGQRQALARDISTVYGLGSDAAPTAPAGSTRLPSLATNGRRDAWRVALDASTREPLLGTGLGTYAREWASERRLTDLYILQPHSLELEVAAELGLGGLGLLAGALAVLCTALARAPARLPAATALATLAVVAGQASFDWTWSFAALVVAGLLICGAALPGRPAAGSRATRLAGVVAAVAALPAAVLYLADRELRAAEARAASAPAEAWRHASAAVRLNPGLAAADSLLGRTAEAAGEPQRAARHYRRAASHSQRPWLDHFRRARALAAAGQPGASRSACRDAMQANPGENALVAGPCTGTAGNAWPVERVRPGGTGRLPESATALADLGCRRCGVDVDGGTVSTRIAGSADTLDTAYVAHDLGRAHLSVGARFTVALGGAMPTRHVVLAQGRDRRNALVWEIYRSGDDGTLRLWSPVGTLAPGPVNRSTGAVLRGGPVAVEVRLVGGRHVDVLVDDRRRLLVRIPEEEPARDVRRVRLGVVGYAGRTTDEAISATFSAVELEVGTPTRES